MHGPPDSLFGARMQTRYLASSKLHPFSETHRGYRFPSVFAELAQRFFLVLLFLTPVTALGQTQVVGTLAGEYSVSDSGAGAYSIPLSIPPGTAGMQPSLSVEYSSSAPSGLLGPGWSLSGLSFVARCAATVPVDGYVGGVEFGSEDRFCLDGQRLIAVTGAYGADGTEYRTQSDSFARVISHGQAGNGPAWFSAELKNGITFELGATADSQLRSSSQSILAWNLNRAHDRQGNDFIVSYLQDLSNGFAAPQRILYTGNSAAGLARYNEVSFAYAPRSFTKDSFVAGERFSVTQRMTQIRTYAEGVPVLTYDLQYDNDPASHEDRLISIQECGASGLCLPATTFTWGAGAGSAFAAGQSFANLSPAQGLWSQYHYPIFSGDLNGDGLTDLMRVQLNGTLTCLNSRTAGFSACQTLNDFGQQSWPETNSKPLVLGDWQGSGRAGVARSSGYEIVSYAANVGGASFTHQPNLYDLSSAQGYNDQVRDPLFVGDWNGDGRSDLARGHLANHIFTIAFDVSNGSGFQTQAVTPLVIPDLYNYWPYVFTGDWNGDGITDLGVTWEEKPAGTNRILFYRGTGSAFVLQQDMPQPVLGAGNEGFSSDTEAILTGDWNADGLTDFAITGFTSVQFFRSTGTQQQFWYQLNDLGRDQVSGSTGATVDGYPIEAGDWNGDGRTDIARVVSNGVRFYVSQPAGLELFTTILDLSPAQGYADNSTRPFVVGDWNGDGATDVGRVGATSVNLFVRSPSATTRVVGVSDGFGKQVEFTYASLTDPTVYTPGSGALFPTVDLQGVGEVVSAVRSSNGLGGWASQLYHYSGLTFDQSRRDANGFAEIDAFDGTTNITTTSFYRQDYPYTGRSYRQERRLQNGTLVGRTTTTWAALTTSPATTFPYAQQTVEESFELNGTPVQATTVVRVYDGFGNITSSTLTRNDGSTETTTSTYVNDVAHWLVGQLTQSRITKVGGGANPPPALTRTTAFSYAPISGLLLSEAREPGNPAFELTKSYTYDVFGNVISVTESGSDFASRTTTSAYDTRGRFLVQSTNALGQSVSQQHSTAWGTPTATTDVNGLTTQVSYDSFGRVAVETRPDGTQAVLTYLWPDTSAPSNAAYGLRKVRTGAPSVLTFYDLLGREIQTRTAGFGGKEIRVDRSYNERGALNLVSEPYFDGDTILWNSSDYDDLGRVTRVTAPGNRQTVVAYNGLTTTTTNALGQTRVEVVDASGLPVSVADAVGTSLQFTRDSYGNPIQVMDGQGNVTFARFDLAGRRVLLDDPDAGVTIFTYNHLGELTSQTNANQETVSFAYDLLGRIVSRTRPEGIEQWVYDAAPHGQGKLAHVVGLNGYREQYGYDALSRLVQTTTKIGGGKFALSQTYDPFGRVRSFTYPSGYSIENSYDPAGYLAAIVELPSRAVLWKALQQNAHGQLEQQAYGNGIQTTKQFDPATGSVQRIRGGSVQDLTFQFDALGNLTQRQDLRVGRSETFAYDSLNRLTSSQVIGAPAVQVSYDAIGNITSRSDVGAYVYGGGAAAGPHAVTAISGVRANAFTYDAAGNRLTSVNGRISYSSTGKPLDIREGSSELQFDLDPSDERVEERRIENGVVVEVKQFVADGMYEQVSRGKLTEFVHYLRSPEGLIAQKKISQTTRPGLPPVTSSALRYLHLDHLGSIQTITDERGGIVEVQSFDGWGNRRNPTTWAPILSTGKSSVDRGFTGHEQLDAVGLIHMNGRVYDPVIGRFVSADPVVQAPLDLQSYNRYSYVLNNPLSLTDPTGYFSFRHFRKSVLRFTRMAIRMVVVNAAMAVGNVIGGPLGAAYLGNFTTSLVNGGSLAKSFRAGFHHLLVDALHAQLDYAIGHGMEGDGGFSRYGAIPLALAHGAADAGYAAATGGNARSAFFSGVGASLGASLGGEGELSRLGASLGGAVGAALGGGKFSDGVMRGAFIYMYNHAADSMQSEIERMYDAHDPWKNFYDPTVGSGASPFSHAHDFLDTRLGQVSAIGALTLGRIGTSVLIVTNDLSVAVGTVLREFPSLRDALVGAALRSGGPPASILSGMGLDKMERATLSGSISMRQYRARMGRARQVFIEELMK